MSTEPIQALTEADLAGIERRADIADSIDYVCDDATMADLRKLLAEVKRLQGPPSAKGERVAAGPDEEFDAVREHALKVGDKRVKDLLDAFDWLRSELAYNERILDYTRQKHTDLEDAFNLVIAQCGKLRAERDGVAGLLDKVMELHPAGFCESCNVEGPCPTRRTALDQTGGSE